jgi:hypothetical protein
MVLRPLGYWEFATVHLANFLCFVGAAGAFEFLLRELAGNESSGGNESQVPIPAWAFRAIALDVGSAHGKFVHPSQKIYDSPPVYAFDGPVGGTLPIWYDPSYWIEGAQPRLVLHRQIVKLFKNGGIYFDLIFTHEVALVAVLIVLFCLGAPGGVGRLLGEWPAWLPALAALAMLIVVIEERYVAVFLIVLWVTLFSRIRLRPEATARRVAVGAAAAVVFALGILWCCQQLRLSTPAFCIISTTRNGTWHSNCGKWG